MVIGGALAFFKHKCQLTDVLSLEEMEEAIALGLCTQEVLCVRAMLNDLGHEQVGAALV